MTHPIDTTTTIDHGVKQPIDTMTLNSNLEGMRAIPPMGLQQSEVFKPAEQKLSTMERIN